MRFGQVLFLAITLSLSGGLSASEESDDRQISEKEQALGQLEWRSIGPANMGGRVTAIAGVAGDPTTYYVGGAHGGVFKTSNGGVTFQAQFQDQRAYSVGALAVAPSDANVIWLGSGEGDPRNSVSYGNGVYRSTDGGRHWSHLGLDDTERIKRIVVHPTDPDTALVCALGHSWGANEERGVFRTIDGGRSWDKVLYIDADTGCSDIAIENANPRILYAGMWTFRRRPWRFDDGGKETALHRSTDGGTTWKKLTGGLPDAPFARIGVAVAQSSPETVYLVSEAPDKGTLFRSDDRGENWRMVSNNRQINFRPFYYSDIRVDPNNPEVVYSLSGGLYKSTDGGRNFNRIGRSVHGDHQSFWIDPHDSRRLLSGSDGGYQVSFDGGATFDVVNNVVLSQFYQIALDDRNPYSVCGGFQDNGTWCGPSRSTHSAGILKRDWFRISGGDGYFAIPKPGQPNLIYTNLQGGVIMVTDTSLGNTRQIHPYPKITGSAGDAIVNHRYRFNWNSPIHISPHDPNTVYFGGNVLFKTSDEGYSWEVISPDLTTDDESKQQTSGGEIYQDNTAAEFHTTLLTIAESPVEAGVIWVGTDDGNVQLTRNAGSTWDNVKDNIAGLPPFSWIGKIETSPHAAGTAYVIADNHRNDDRRPYIFKTSDYGLTWTPIHAGLPADDYVHVVREDPRVPDLLYAGMEHGIFVSWDGGGSWSSLRTNLPPVSVRDIQIHARENDLVIGTHGRGAWILDDLGPVQQLVVALQEKVHLFEIRPAHRWQIASRTASRGERAFAANNPPVGSLINFFLAEAPDSDESPEAGVRVEILDQDGEKMTTLKPRDLQAGVNRVVWNLRMQGRPDREREGGRARFGGGGPRVPPASYTAVLIVGETRQQAAFEVLADPRADLSDADYQQQFATARALHDLQGEVDDFIHTSEEVIEQLTSLKGRLAASASDGNPIREAIDQAVSELEAFLDDDLRRPPPNMGYRQRPRLREQLRSLLGAVDRVTARPTQPQELRLQELTAETERARTRFSDFKQTHLEPINQQLEKVPHILLPKRDGQ